MLKLKLQYFGHLMWRTGSLEKTLMLGRIEDRRRDRGWDGWMTSPTWWTWVWARSRSWCWIGKPGVLQSRGVTKSWTQLSGWTEHIIHSTFVQIQRMHRVLQVALVVTNSVANAGDIRNTGSIPGSGRYLGGQYSNPLQYSCLMSPVDRGAWWITVHGVTKNCTRLRDLANTHA